MSFYQYSSSLSRIDHSGIIIALERLFGYINNTARSQQSFSAHRPHLSISSADAEHDKDHNDGSLNGTATSHFSKGYVVPAATKSLFLARHSGRIYPVISNLHSSSSALILTITESLSVLLLFLISFLNLISRIFCMWHRLICDVSKGDGLSTTTSYISDNGCFSQQSSSLHFHYFKKSLDRSKHASALGLIHMA